MASTTLCSHCHLSSGPQPEPPKIPSAALADSTPFPHPTPDGSYCRVARAAPPSAQGPLVVSSDRGPALGYPCPWASLLAAPALLRNPLRVLLSCPGPLQVPPQVPAHLPGLSGGPSHPVSLFTLPSSFTPLLFCLIHLSYLFVFYASFCSLECKLYKGRDFVPPLKNLLLSTALVTMPRTCGGLVNTLQNTEGTPVSQERAFRARDLLPVFTSSRSHSVTPAVGLGTVRAWHMDCRWVSGLVWGSELCNFSSHLSSPSLILCMWEVGRHWVCVRTWLTRDFK